MYRAYDTKFNRRGVYPLSKQLKDYLLCEKCEQLLRERGEDWATANCCRDDGTFRALDLLRSATPISDDTKIQIYSGGDVSGFDLQAIVYFGMSVFWRAAVHEWRDNYQVTHIDLGPFEERIRRYLLGGPFPRDVALVFRVIADPDVARAAYPPVSGKASGFHYHKFIVSGFAFILFAGSKIPQESLKASTAPAPEGYVSVYPKCDGQDFEEMVELYRSSLKG